MTTPTTCTVKGKAYTLTTGTGICNGCVAESPTSEPTKLCIELGACMTFNGAPFEGIWVEADEAPVTEGERSLYRYKFEQPGSFERNLWETIFSADLGNLERLSAGFPSHADAFHRYANERGYWDALIARIRKLENA